ncbi:helix-turn-helix transcriptional regulator [Lysobacter sp. LF1]|uniref:Helix-turn-helix transcriptional regulator n=1 Tax=Lysobacter stagni TaxID=3045172 RepID=A0ABT6XLE7_9GAMM|nr:helix-turn-helix transcriptional regulator [Lysobacter sp. LF1]MDI9240768.1 helix-turn-helix transcriptional regulator [Lysobacter sp. LF1]
MSELKDRAIEARLAAGVDTPAEWARRLGVKPAAIYQIESGKTRSLKANTLAQMARLSGLDPEYIRTGRPGAPTAPAKGAQLGGLIDTQLFLYADEIVRHEERMQGADFPSADRMIRLIAMYNLAIEHGGVIPRGKLIEIAHAAYRRNPEANESSDEPVDPKAGST